MFACYINSIQIKKNYKTIIKQNRLEFNEKTKTAKIIISLPPRRAEEAKSILYID